MAKSFGTLPNGQEAKLYTISCGSITADITDYGATLVRLWVPDKDGCVADVVLGYDDANSIPTGEERNAEGTPFDFRKAKPIGQDIDADYECLKLQGGYDHNFEVYSNPAAILTAPDGSRTMMVYTDLPGIQFYSGNYIDNEKGKNGVVYTKRGGICLETQYYPDALHHPEWEQPITLKGTPYYSETVYWFY